MVSVPNYSGGFTLLEIMIAIGILLLGLVTVFSLFPVGIVSVRGAVDATRGATLAKSARAQLAAERADLQIQASGSQYYAGSYVPFGPWHYPADVTVFRKPLYDYGDGTSRVVFDERTMVPLKLMGTFNGKTITLDNSLYNPDVNRLKRPLDAGCSFYGGIQQSDGWHYFTFTGYGPAGGFITSLSFDAFNPPTAPPAGVTAIYAFYPIAMREPPAEVPLDWDGLAGAFDEAGPTYDVDDRNPDFNVRRYLCETNGWVSINGIRPGQMSGPGDWFKMTHYKRVGNGQYTLANNADLKASLFGNLSNAQCKVILPVAEFIGPDSTNKIYRMNIYQSSVDGSATVINYAGGAPQLTWLETGASIEIVFDGGYGTFDAANGTHVTNTRLDPDTQGFIAAGNFIRINGRDYRIMSVQGSDIVLDRTVPTLGSDVYFNIVLGDAANPIQEPVRFPVAGIHRYDKNYPSQITAFDISRDEAGHFPSDLGCAANLVNPVHVLPRNYSQFSYQVVLTQKSPAGYPDSSADTIIWTPYALTSSSTPAINTVFPAFFQKDVYLADNSEYPFLALAEPAATNPVAINASITAQSNVGDKWTVNYSDANRIKSGAYITPFHVFDKNSLTSNVYIGRGMLDLTGSEPAINFAPTTNSAYANGDISSDFSLLGVLSTDTSIPNSMTPPSQVRIEGVNGLTLDTIVTAIAKEMTSISIADVGTFTQDDVVTVTLLASNLTDETFPCGRGAFTQGSNVIVAVYDDYAAYFSNLQLPGNGLPIAGEGAAREQLAVGDYILAPDGQWYAVAAINDYPQGSKDTIILDRPYTGRTSPVLADGDYFRYVTPLPAAYDEQVAVFRNYDVRGLQGNATFGLDSNNWNAGGDMRGVSLPSPLPPDVKSGDHVRADGDIVDPNGFGSGSPVEGDHRWYMIDSISNDRTQIILARPYRGYVPAAGAVQPIAYSDQIVETFDTTLGAF